jgi:hypothetical protein
MLTARTEDGQLVHLDVLRPQEEQYWGRTGQVCDELFPLLEGRGPLEAGGLGQWYSVRVAGDDTAWGTLIADPLEAPGAVGIARPASAAIRDPHRDRRLGPAHRDPGRRALAQALTDWSDEVLQNVGRGLGGGRAGQAVRQRWTGRSVPTRSRRATTGRGCDRTPPGCCSCPMSTGAAISWTPSSRSPSSGCGSNRQRAGAAAGD